MCGIAGYTRFHHPEGDESALHAMGQAIFHRGPDAGGVYLDDQVGLCHRRLSILDLSEAGNQPMFSDDERYVIVFNGEIYNFLELRAELEKAGHTFRSHTDTEVILKLFAEHGEQCLSMLNGMFAFALWDTHTHSLFIARDRLGKKPLYYYQTENRFAFASEIKAILALEDIDKTLDHEAIHDYFAYQYVPDPKSIFARIRKLPPAHYMTINADGIHVQRYWSLSFANVRQQSEEQNTADLKSLLEDVTSKRMISDVPLGAFLSGGVDSSGVVAMMSQASDKPVKTCTIGFDDEAFNESEFAREIAQLYKTEHHEFTVHQNVAERLEQIVGYFDEPFADPSLVPTYFVSELARKAVTVAVAGDGGDEMFAGYEKYTTDDIENKLRARFPLALREKLFPKLAGIAGKLPGTLGKKAKSLLTSLSQTPGMGFYITNSQMTDEEWQSLVTPELQGKLGSYHPSENTLRFYNECDGEDHLSKILYTDINTYLCGGILVKVDRMSMANSLEVRAPLLDYQVAEFAASLPGEQKYKQGTKKYLLKRVFEPFIPDSLLHRKKMGFSVPLDAWFRGELKPLAERCLLAPNKGLHSVFRVNAIERLWKQHQASSHNHGAILWSMLIFQLWHERYCSDD
ncbi:asparagine synthase (glutamine-hydrolyzing) [Alteromonas sp. ASW11-19]|uniref:asparagine synthase (glutamine-hydrolyzing) n=1 Tax=Alteromonas salexigens TaxID=2982530 RepID=A0ABT2VUU5_9ALTE|nr:asparagine synthase (glutamine-hydrolyzing) [Alteromonas salexigens]MCU7555629.1 asparagine synthase (glutamine-hydrolyzing) [Alteromonas salexigens]